MVKFAVVNTPPQVVTFAGWFTCAVGFTVMVTETGVPEQLVPPLENTGVAVMVAITGAPPLFTAVNDAISPEPLAARPMPGALFVQLNTVPGTAPVKLIAVVADPLHSVWLVCEAETVGAGFTVTVN